MVQERDWLALSGNLGTLFFSSYFSFRRKTMIFSFFYGVISLQAKGHLISISLSGCGGLHLHVITPSTLQPRQGYSLLNRNPFSSTLREK